MSDSKPTPPDLSLFKLGSLVYPIMLAQERSEISEAKAAELIGLDIVTYREQREQAIATVRILVESLPSPLVLLLGGTKGRHESSTSADE